MDSEYVIIADLLEQPVTLHLRSGQIIEGTLSEETPDYLTITNGVVYTPVYKSASSRLDVSRAEIIIFQEGKGTMRLPKEGV